MPKLQLEKVCTLLGTENIRGTKNELEMLCVRICELVELNGEDWVVKNRRMLIDQWAFIVNQSIIR